MRECVWALYFSPTGGTKKAAIYLAESLGKEVKEADLADPDFKGAAFKAGEGKRGHGCDCGGLWKQGF